MNCPNCEELNKCNCGYVNIKKVTLAIIVILCILIGKNFYVNFFSPSSDKAGLTYMVKDFNKDIQKYISNLDDYYDSGDKVYFNNAKDIGKSLIVCIKIFTIYTPIEHDTLYSFQWLQECYKDLNAPLEKAIQFASIRDSSYKKYTDSLEERTAELQKNAKKLYDDLSPKNTLNIILLAIAIIIYKNPNIILNLRNMLQNRNNKE